MANKFLNGVGYLGSKVGVGFMQTIEGLWDFTAGGLADLFDADEYAKRQMQNDWFGDWYQTAGSKFDATGGWQTAGNVAGAVGSALPAVVITLLGIGATAITGGGAAPVAVTAISSAISTSAPYLSLGVTIGGAAGNATKEAMRESGALSLKEYGYGALSGATEGALEAVTGGLGKGTGKLLKTATKTAAKTAADEAAEALAKQSAKTILAKLAKEAGGDFISEATEEGLAEALSPYFKRMTYDKTAENASFEEIMYAAYIGGITGTLMGTAYGVGGAGATYIAEAKAGGKLVNDGYAESILALANQLSAQMGEGDHGYTLLNAISELSQSLNTSVSETGGITTLGQKAKLGRLNKLMSMSSLLPQIEESAKNLIRNPNTTVEKFNQLGVTDADGSPLTVEKLTAGIEIDENGGASVLSLRKALSSNSVLSSLAVADAMGRIMVSNDTYASNVETGDYIGGRAQYETFTETATPEQKAAVARLIGEQNLDAIEYRTFANRMKAYSSSVEGKARIESAKKARKDANSVPENELAIPRAISPSLEDGVHRFGGKDGIAIIKEGDNVRIYDYSTGNISRDMTVAEANSYLLKNAAGNVDTKEKAETKPSVGEELDAYARENVPGYESLPANGKREIRALIRQARALGVPEADILMYARVSARSGVRITFSKERCRYTKKDGTEGYLDGFYHIKNTEIVINPEGKRTSAKVLMHELSHALFGYGKYRTILAREMKRMDEARADEIIGLYENKSELVKAEELAVHHVEDVLGNTKTLERVLADEPSIKTKILSFFKLAKSDYAGNERLSRSAGRLYERFEQAFKDFGDRNRVNLGYEAMPLGSTEIIRGTQDGAVVSNPVNDMIAAAFTDEIRASIATETTPLPKQEMRLSGGDGTILDSIEGVKPTPVKGLSDRSVNGFTGRDVRSYAMMVSGFDKTQISRVNKFMDRMAKFMKKAGVTYRFIGLQDVENAQLHYTRNPDGSIKSIVLSAMVKNGDYPVNFDLSSICKKRVAMSTLIDKLAQRGSLDNGTVALDPSQIFAINTALKNAGYETACLGCFVESKRYNAMAWATEFCKKWNAAVKAVNRNATYFGYGDGSNVADVTLEQAVRLDEAAQKFNAETKTKRLEQALKKYKDREAKGLQLVESKNKVKVDGNEITSFSKAARDRIIKSETISDDLKTKYLTTDVADLNMADVEFLLVNGILPGVAMSNKQTVKALVESGEDYQHLLRPSDLLTAKGIDKLRELPNFHGVLYGHYGSATPKLVQSFTPYNSEIALLPSKKGGQSLAEYLYSIAGVRMQSFSDFQIQNIYDYLQMVADLAARKLPAHAYTKEISFARLLGMTGIKTNLSVMFDIDPTVDKTHAGLTKRIPFIHKGEYGVVVWKDESGEYVYNVGDYATQKAFMEANPDDERRFLQSIGFADAVKLQSTEGYSSNCGIIGVGYSDLHILAMLNDYRIRYVIPYHASGLPAVVKLATNIANATDYTSTQNTMKIDSIVDKKGNPVEWSVKEAYKRLGSGKAVMEELNAKIKNEGWEVKTKKAQNGHGSFGLYEDLQSTNDPRKTVSNFMDWCAKNNTLPLFYQFSAHENYYKLIYDFNVYDCITEQYAPQQAVTNTYPDADMRPVDAAEADLDTSYLEGAIDKQMAFMERYSESLDSDLDAMADDLSMAAVPSEDLDASYLDAVNRGDMETAQKMVDEAAKKAGYTVKGLHATNAEFTVFDINKTSSENFHGKGIYFTNSVIDVENNYENYEGPDPWQKIEGRAYELVYDKYGISYEDTLTSDSEIIDKLNECYDIAIDEFKKNGRRITAYLRFDNPLILEKGMQIPYDYAGYDGIIDKQVYENIGHSGMDENTIHYVVFNPNNIKSADTVTYDDDGNVIPLSKRFDADNEDIRWAIPDESDSVRKTRREYEASRKEKFFTAKDRAYIETVDELYGLSKYLQKVGKMPKGKVAAIVQMARASRSQAQTMIDSDQYDVFADNPTRLGDGLIKIYNPTMKWSEEKRTDFELYLLHYLNIDRMTLESRSKLWTAAERAQIAKVESNIATIEDGIDKLQSEIGKAETAIVNARVREKVSKRTDTKQMWKNAVEDAKKRKESLEAALKQERKTKAAKEAELAKLRAELKALELKNMPVFGKDETLDENGNMKRDHDITAAESSAIVKGYEQKYPEFVDIAKKIYAYLDNNQASRVKAGLISQESADRMKQLYPHYVPAYRDKNGVKIAVVRGKNNMAVSSTIKKAKGGSSDILDIATSIAEQTDELMRAGRINMLARALYDVAKDTDDTTYVEILSEEDVKKEDLVGTRTDNKDSVNFEGKEIIDRPKNGQITFFKDGKKVTMRVSKEIELAFDGLRSPTVDFTNPLFSIMSKVNSLFKRGVTSLNPAFMLRNPVRDLQDAGLNSKHPVLFPKELATAGIDIAKNSEEWKLYRALGGFSSTVFEGSLAKKGGYAGFESVSALFSTDAKGLAKAWHKTKALAVKSPLAAVENANAVLEQITRFAEFKASLKAGDSPAVALNNSAEVTTNFGRRGRTSKVLNATIMPFLNPAIQGFDKIFRNVGDAFTSKHYVKGIAELIVKAALIGVAPILLNSIMYDDDEDYEKLRETDKENYFLVKIGDGNFIKIPRGRLASVIGGAYSRATKAIKGEEVDAGDYVSNVITQVTPVENLTRTIFSPIFDVRNNRTWYGGEIEGQEFDDTSPRQRYDESTSTIAVAIGQVIPEGWNMSPKKIHYLLDQYSGVIGDFVLPATSQKEHKGFFSGNFTIDSVTNNKLSTQFYDLYEKTQYADTAGDEVASYRLKYLNRVKKSIREMNKEIDAVRASDISNKEKMAQVRVIRSLINAAYDSALKSVTTVDEAIAETSDIKDETLRDTEVTRRVFGAETAIKNYNSKLYEKLQLFNKAGIGYDELYVFHFATLDLEADVDKKGDVVEGSKRKKVVAAINSLKIPSMQKILLLASKGYAIKDGDIRGVSAERAKKMLLSYIMRQGLTKEEKAALAKACGFTVKNGVIVNKS